MVEENLPYYASKTYVTLTFFTLNSLYFNLKNQITYFELLLKFLKTDIVSPTAMSATSEFRTSGV